MINSGINMKNPHAQELGRLGGLAKAAKMTDEERERMRARAEQARAKKAQRDRVRKGFIP